MKSNCSNGEVRLVGGASNVSGRVEICHNRAWATVCNRLWRVEDATVVCRQLGLQMHEGEHTLCLIMVLIFQSMHSDFEVRPSSNYANVGSGPIFGFRLGCSGLESSIGECDFPSGSFSQSCDHFDDVMLQCLREFKRTHCICLFVCVINFEALYVFLHACSTL